MQEQCSLSIKRNVMKKSNVIQAIQLTLSQKPKAGKFEKRTLVGHEKTKRALTGTASRIRGIYCWIIIGKVEKSLREEAYVQAKNLEIIIKGKGTDEVTCRRISLRS